MCDECKGEGCIYESRTAHCESPSREYERDHSIERNTRLVWEDILEETFHNRNYEPNAEETEETVRESFIRKTIAAEKLSKINITSMNSLLENIVTVEDKWKEAGIEPLQKEEIKRLYTECMEFKKHDWTNSNKNRAEYHHIPTIKTNLFTDTARITGKTREMLKKEWDKYVKDSVEIHRKYGILQPTQRDYVMYEMEPPEPNEKAVRPATTEIDKKERKKAKIETDNTNDPNEEEYNANFLLEDLKLPPTQETIKEGSKEAITLENQYILQFIAKWERSTPSIKFSVQEARNIMKAGQMDYLEPQGAHCVYDRNNGWPEIRRKEFSLGIQLYEWDYIPNPIGGKQPVLHSTFVTTYDRKLKEEVIEWREKNWTYIWKMSYAQLKIWKQNYVKEVMKYQSKAVKGIKLGQKEIGLITTGEKRKGQDEEEIYERIFIADSGASCHMTHSDKGMFDFKKVKDKITVGNGEAIYAEKIGKLRGTVVQANGKKRHIILENVRYVPKLAPFNLFRSDTSIISFVCLSCNSLPKFLVNKSALFSSVLTKRILINPFSINSFTNRSLVSTCFVLCDTARFSAMKIAPILSTLTMIGNSTLIPMLSRI